MRLSARTHRHHGGFSTAVHALRLRSKCGNSKCGEPRLSREFTGNVSISFECSVRVERWRNSQKFVFRTRTKGDRGNYRKFRNFGEKVGVKGKEGGGRKLQSLAAVLLTSC